MSVSTIEVSQKALVHNALQFKKIIRPRVKLLAVVKANGYGHGLECVASVVARIVDWFGVDTFLEAFAIRQLGIRKPILVLGYVPPEDLKECSRQDIRVTVYTKEIVQALTFLKKPIKIHLKIETGTNRQGIQLVDLFSLTRLIKKHRTVQIEGISTHFANIEDTLDRSFAKQQIEIFHQALAILLKEGVAPQLKHVAATATTILYPETHFDMVRIGIGLYGLWPSQETQIVAKTKHKGLMLKPVLTWKTRIVQIKKIQPGESVGYGRTWVAARPTTVAVLPVGYYDGYDRRLSQGGRVLVNGSFSRVIGRVAMNMMMIDVTDISKIVPNDEVVLIGEQKGNRVAVSELADSLGTINYEVVARLNPLISRILID